VDTAPEKKKALEEYQARMGGQEAFENFLKELGVSEEELNKSLVSNLMRKKLLEKLAGNYTPKASEVKEFYAKNKEKFKQQEEVQASHILFKFEKDITDDAKKAKLKAANEVLALAQKKGADFSELAKKHSEGPTAPKGGDLGWFSRGRMIKEFEEAAFKAKVGDVVGPVETVFGYHIIKTSGHKDAKQRAFAEVKDEIEQNLTVSENAKRAQVAMEKLKEKAKINVFEPSLMPKKDVTETAQK